MPKHARMTCWAGRSMRRFRPERGSRLHSLTARIRRQSLAAGQQRSEELRWLKSSTTLQDPDPPSWRVFRLWRRELGEGLLPHQPGREPAPLLGGPLAVLHIPDEQGERKKRRTDASADDDEPSDSVQGYVLLKRAERCSFSSYKVLTSSPKAKRPTLTDRPKRLILLVPVKGIEPSTFALQVRCSTN